MVVASSVFMRLQGLIVLRKDLLLLAQALNLARASSQSSADLSSSAHAGLNFFAQKFNLNIQTSLR